MRGTDGPTHILGTQARSVTVLEEARLTWLPPRRSHMLWYILLAILWILIAFWPARVAARKGHSFFLFFLFSLVFFPLALLVAYMVSDRRVAAVTY
jgi:hypothetical protein